MKLSSIPCSLTEARRQFDFPKKFHLDPDCCEYFSAYTEMVDLSFGVTDGSRMLAWLGVALSPTECSFFGWPVEYIEKPDLDALIRIELRKFILSSLIEIAQGRTLHLPSLPMFGKWAALSNAKVITRLRAQIDLNLKDDEIKKSIRDSYRSLINKGMRELETIVHVGPNVQESVLIAARDFHVKVSGRQTRSNLTWEIQYVMVTKSKAILIEGKINGIASTYTYIMCSQDEAYYGFGVYDRELMAQGIPLSHWPVFSAIIESRKLGMKTFILGDVGPNFETQKEAEIAVFKRGFTDLLVPLTTYKLNPVSLEK